MAGVLGDSSPVYGAVLIVKLGYNKYIAELDIIDDSKYIYVVYILTTLDNIANLKGGFSCGADIAISRQKLKNVLSVAVRPLKILLQKYIGVMIVKHLLFRK